MRRWVINFGRLGSIRIHRWYRSDDKRYFHDHPWWFLTIVLQGGYTDVSPQGREKVGRGGRRWAYRSALHRHTVEVDPGGAVTFMITGPFSRKWGFWVEDKFVGVRKYFRKYGHPPCSEG